MINSINSPQFGLTPRQIFYRIEAFPTRGRIRHSFDTPGFANADLPEPTVSAITRAAQHIPEGELHLTQTPKGWVLQHRLGGKAVAHESIPYDQHSIARFFRFIGARVQAAKTK